MGLACDHTLLGESFVCKNVVLGVNESSLVELILKISSLTYKFNELKTVFNLASWPFKLNPEQVRFDKI